MGYKRPQMSFETTLGKRWPRDLEEIWPCFLKTWTELRALAKSKPSNADEWIAHWLKPIKTLFAG